MNKDNQPDVPAQDRSDATVVVHEDTIEHLPAGAWDDTHTTLMLPVTGPDADPRMHTLAEVIALEEHVAHLEDEHNTAAVHLEAVAGDLLAARMAHATAKQRIKGLL